MSEPTNIQASVAHTRDVKAAIESALDPDWSNTKTKRVSEAIVQALGNASLMVIQLPFASATASPSPTTNGDAL